MHSIRTKIQEVNSKLFNHLHQIKAQKFDQLTGPPITCDSSLESLNTVVTIPENLSLCDAEKSVLSKGLNFVPISKKLDEFSVKQDVEKFLRRIQLKAFSMIKRMILTPRTKTFSRRFRLENRSGLPQRASLPLDFFIKKCRHDINKLNFNRNTKFSNLSSEERAALENLSKRKDLIVKAADKGGALVVWRADLYQKEALRQLSDTSFYAKVDKDLTSTNQQIVKSTINDLIVKQELPATATNLIITTPRTSCIYFLPKIHKPNNPGRPIVSACSCPTELIASYLDKIMAPIVRSLPSYVKDSQHALQFFCDFNFLGEDKLIFTMDITSLYTVIPNGEGLLPLKHFFDLCTVKEPSSETLLCLAELVLTLNCFSFAGSYYKQINGVAMGTKIGPSYANLFIGYIEHKFFNQYNGPKPELYRCYIDDCVGATSSTREELNQFVTAVN